jgi:hypothetical protein
MTSTASQISPRRDFTNFIEAKLTPEHEACIAVLQEHGFSIGYDRTDWTRVYESKGEPLGRACVYFNVLDDATHAPIRLKAGSYDKPSECPRVRASWESHTVDPDQLRYALNTIEQLYLLQS